MAKHRAPIFSAGHTEALALMLVERRRQQTKQANLDFSNRLEVVMGDVDVSRGAGFAGAVVFAMPALDILLGDGAVGVTHAVVGSFGLALFAISAAAGAGRV
jgi:hypothetical protein